MVEELLAAGSVLAAHDPRLYGLLAVAVAVAAGALAGTLAAVLGRLREG
ncbi:MAG: hypothetical protein H5T97_14535 [Firmicutes bacterium]|nr:hypothetical protein [Bacillota bacterium]